MNKKDTIVLFLLICISSFCLTAVAAHSTTKSELLRRLENAAPDDTTRLGICYQLTRIAENLQVELYYTNLLMKDAERLNNNKYRCLSYLGRMVLAYNSYNVEEVNRWMRLLEPIAEKEKYYDYLFLGKRCVIDMMLVKGEYEREEKEAQRMLQRAKTLENKIGIILAYQCLSNVYTTTYRVDEAAKMKEKAYEVANGYELDFALELNNSLVRIYEEQKEYKKQLIWMKRMDENLQRVTKEDPLAADKYALWISMNLVSYLNYYTSVGKLKEATEYLKKLEQNQNIGYESYMVNLHIARSRYYYAMNMLPEVLNEAEQLIQIHKKDISLKTYVGMISVKANILAEMGREDEAIAMYKRNLFLTDSVNIVLLNKQMEQMELDYKTDTLLLEKENIHWYIQCFFLILVLIVIVVMIFFMLHAKRIQKELKKSEREMRLMAERMEQANEAKEKFLSTISASINVPLNVVVTESLRLASDEVIAIKEREEISQRLNKTSAELMKLINNILNLSKLEAGMMKFKEEDLEIIPYIKSIIAGKIFEGTPVTLISSEAVESCSVCVDAERLREVLDYMLVPSAAGEELAFEIKRKNHNELEFCVRGTILAAQSQYRTQEDAVENEVVRLSIVHFGGTYQVVSVHPSIVCFTFPIVKP